MGIFSAIAQGLRNVVSLGRAVGGFASRVGQKAVKGTIFVGKKIGEAVRFLFQKRAPMVPVRETILEAGEATRNARIPVARVIQEVKGVIPPGEPGIPSYAGFGAKGSVAPRMTISAPIATAKPITNLNKFPIAPTTTGFKDFSRATKSTINQLNSDVFTAGSKAQLRNVAQEQGFYYGNPKRAELLRGVLKPATDLTGAKSLPLGSITQRGLGGLSKAQRTSNEINRIGELGRGRIADLII